MKKIIKYIKEKPQCLLLLYWLFHSVWYEILQQTTMDRNPIPISCEWDKYIPLWEFMVIPYGMWFIQIAGMMGYTLIKQPKKLFRIIAMVGGGGIICMTICSVIPMYFDRSALDMTYANNIFGDIVALIHKYDEPTTVLPSMHVFVTVSLHICLCKDESLSKHKWLKICSLVLCVSITAATALIKQHSLLDIASALALVPVMYCVAYLPKYKFLGDFIEQEKDTALV